MEAGKNGILYEKVCPENLEPAFLASYEIGRKIHTLEVENSELSSRISVLDGLLDPRLGSSSVKDQIDQLKGRRSLNNQEIDSLEELSQFQPIWVDLESPTLEEKRWVKQYYGLSIPEDVTDEDIEESARF